MVTATDDAYFSVSFIIKKFKSDFPVSVVADSYILNHPSTWHIPSTQLSKSYIGAETKFVANGTTFYLFANCVDKFTGIGRGPHQPKFYHYLDPNVPDVYKANFYKINYLINAAIKETLASLYPGGWSFMDIQYAIWDLVHPTSDVYSDAASYGGFHVPYDMLVAYIQANPPKRYPKYYEISGKVAVIVALPAQVERLILLRPSFLLCLLNCSTIQRL